MNIGLGDRRRRGAHPRGAMGHRLRAELREARREARHPVIIGALLGIGMSRQRKGGTVAPAVFWSIGILTLLNAAIAVIWR